MPCFCDRPTTRRTRRAAKKPRRTRRPRGRRSEVGLLRSKRLKATPVSCFVASFACIPCPRDTLPVIPTLYLSSHSKRVADFRLWASPFLSLFCYLSLSLLWDFQMVSRVLNPQEMRYRLSDTVRRSDRQPSSSSARPFASFYFAAAFLAWKKALRQARPR